MIREKIESSILKNAPECIALSDWIFDHPETGRQEFQAAEKLESFLESQGFAVEKGVGGIETAFRAVWENGQGGPSIGLLCEYDALPMGHACGHHMQGPAICLAAAALKDAAGETPLKIVVYGTPDEEYGDGKITMLENGCFQDIDVAIMTHGGPNTTVDVKSMALRNYVCEFRGKAAHAAMAPEAGRSAVDAMMLALHGMELLREHVADDVRMHYHIAETSSSANVVPEYAKLEFMVRSYNTGVMRDAAKRVEKCMEGGAYMTDTTAELKLLSEVQAKVPMYTLNERVMQYAKKFDAPQRIPYREKTGSTDFGNVLHQVPGVCVRIAFVLEGTPSHSQGFLDAGKSEALHKGIETSARMMANLCADLAEDEEFFAAVKAEFARNLQAETSAM